jgi:hypothetical protein
VATPEATHPIRDNAYWAAKRIQAKEQRLAQKAELQALEQREVRARLAVSAAAEQHLPAPAALALYDVVRRRQDLPLQEAIQIVSEVFADE